MLSTQVFLRLFGNLTEALQVLWDSGRLSQVKFDDPFIAATRKSDQMKASIFIQYNMQKPMLRQYARLLDLDPTAKFTTIGSPWPANSHFHFFEEPDCNDVVIHAHCALICSWSSPVRNRFLWQFWSSRANPMMCRKRHTRVFGRPPRIIRIWSFGIGKRA